MSNSAEKLIRFAQICPPKRQVYDIGNIQMMEASNPLMQQSNENGRTSQHMLYKSSSTAGNSSVQRPQNQRVDSHETQGDKDEEGDEMNSTDIDPCSSPQCQRLNPHVHAVGKCTHHQFCGVPDFIEVPATDLNTMLPIPAQYYSKNNPPNMRQNLKNFQQLVGDKRSALQLKDMGLKVVVTDKALASWYAQTVKIDMKKEGRSQDQDKLIKAKDDFQKKLNRRSEEVELLEHIKKSRNKGLLGTNDDQTNEVTAMADTNIRTEQERLALQMAKQMKPMVYPQTKNVKHYSELQDDFNVIKHQQDKQKEKVQKAQARADLHEQADPDTPIRLSRQNTHKGAIGMIGGTRRSQNFGIDTIEEVSGFNSMEPSPVAKGTHQGRNDYQHDMKVEINATLSQNLGRQRNAPLRLTQQHSRPRRQISQIMQKKYNPYSAECRNNFDGISRAEIDKLMFKVKRDKELRLQRRLDPKTQQHQPVVQRSLDTTAMSLSRSKNNNSEVGINLLSQSNNKQKVRSLTINKAVAGKRVKSHLRYDATMRARREQQFREKMGESLRSNQPYVNLSQQLDTGMSTNRDVAKGCFQFFGEVTSSETEKVKGLLPRSSTLGSNVILTTKGEQEFDKVQVSKNLVEKLKKKRKQAQETRHQAQQIQDLAISSLMSASKSRVRSNNDRSLQEIVEKRYYSNASASICIDRGRSTASITNHLGASYGGEEQYSPQQAQPYRQSSTSQPGSRARNGTSQVQRIRSLVDGGQDLRRNSRSNQIYSYPYASGITTEVKVIDEAKLDASLLEDFKTLTQDKKDYHTYVEEQTPEINTARITKTVNSVSFLQVQGGDSPTLIIDNNKLNMSEDEASIQQEKVSSLKPTSLRNFAIRTEDGQSTNDEKSMQTAPDAVTSQQSHLSARTKASSAGYYVQTHDYNFEVIEPSKYYQKELFIQLPLCQPNEHFAKHTSKDLDIFKSAEFWLMKGYGIQSRAHLTGNRKSANEADNVALDYYLSGVKIDPRHDGCVFNAGCCHFFTGKFQNARKWFHLTTLVKPLCPDGYYCKALACLRLGLYEEALESILIIDQPEESKSAYETISIGTSQQSSAPAKMESSSKFSAWQITLLHAVCCKIQGKHDQAEALYQRLSGPIHMQMCKQMIQATFSVILVPLQKERTITEQNVNFLKKQINMYDPEFLYDESVSKDLQKIGQPNVDLSDNKRLQFFAKYLHRLPFFRRLSEEKLSNKYIDKVTLVEREKGSLILIPDNNAVMVVLNGQIVLRHHELDQPDTFDIRSIAKMGHVLFAPELDDNSNKPLVWPVINSEKAQLALISRPVFTEMWKDSIKRDLEVALSQLNLNLFFKNVSRQTFQRLITEKSHLRRFKKGQLVLPIHPRSPWNNQLYMKNQKRQQVILEQLEESNKGVKMHLATGSKAVMHEQWNELQRQKTKKPPNKMAQALGIAIIAKAEKMAAEASASAVTSRQPSKRDKTRNEFSPVTSTFSQQSSTQSGYGATIKDSNSDYQKLIKSLGQKERRYTDAEMLRKALQKRKCKAQKQFKEMYPDGTEAASSENSQTPLGHQGHINPLEISFVRPIMLLFRGSARCINNYFPGVTFTAKRLATGSLIGESDTLQRVGIEFLGDIYAEQDGLVCLAIDRPDLCLDNFEIKILQKVLGKQNKELINMLETRFDCLQRNSIKDY